MSSVSSPAVPPLVPVAIAFAGGFGGLWYLTLGQNPANPMPGWSPAIGWSVGLGSLALAAVFAWMGISRRRCPECGCTRMLDAMEEEGLNASERLAARENELRITEQDLRARLLCELQPQVERDLRPIIEKELRGSLGNELKSESEKSRAQMEKQLRPQIEYEVRKELEKQLRAEHERQSAEHERVLRRKLEEELRPEIEKQLRMTLPKEAKPAETGATPPPTGPTTSLPRMTAGRPAPAVAPMAVSQPAAKTGTHAPGAVARTAQPAARHTNIETVPLSLRPSRATAGSPASAMSGGQSQVQEPAKSPPVADGHERARRRARVILSDLSLYHRDALLKAARAEDAKTELGTLWRDAVISYNEVVSSDISSATNYLEEELQKHLTQLRQA